MREATDTQLSSDDPARVPPPVTRRSTVTALADRARRGFVPVRRTFVQKTASAKTRADGRSGPLATFVRTGDDRGLDALLLVLTAASRDPWNVSLAADVWARALGISVTKPSAAMSKVWRRLEDRKLITRSRSGRMADVTPLREDGSGADYTRPDGKKVEDRFLKLDHAYWTDGWHETLTLPGKAMLLLALGEKPGFELPYERAPEWYGLSADSVHRGFNDLLRHGLISYDREYRSEPLSAIGYVEIRKWWVRAPFSGPDS